MNIYSFFLLCILIVFLPLSEALKNISSIFLLGLLLWELYKQEGSVFSNGLLRWFDFVFLFFFLSVFLSLTFSFPFDSDWSELVDVFRYLSIAWLLSRIPLGEKQLLVFYGLLILSTFIGSVDGVFHWLYLKNNVYFELKSVGHVNHSSIYLVIVALINAVMLFLYRGRWQTLLIFIFFMLSLFVVFAGGSRASALAFLVSLVVILSLIIMREGASSVRSMLYTLGACLGVFLVVSVFMPNQVTSLFLDGGNVSQLSSKRFELANVAWEAFKQYSFFGVGSGNFNEISPQVLQGWISPEKLSHDYFFSAHAHNLYANIMAERGGFGFFALMSLLLFWLYALYAFFPNNQGSLGFWLAWAGAASAGFIVIINGLANTTLHHEHGQLSMILLGVFIGQVQSLRKDKGLV